MDSIGKLLGNTHVSKIFEDKQKGRFGVLPMYVLTNYAKNIGTTAFAVYCSLCAYANNKTNVAWPSYNTLASYLGITRRTVIRNVKILEKAGLIKNIEKLSGDGTKMWYIMDRFGSQNPCKNNRGGDMGVTGRVSSVSLPP